LLAVIWNYITMHGHMNIKRFYLSGKTAYTVWIGACLDLSYRIPCP